MRYTITFEKEMNIMPTIRDIIKNIHIAQGNELELEFSDNINSIDFIKNVTQTAADIVKNTEIHINCKMLKDIQQVLPLISSITIRLSDSDNFQKFLEMDNRLNKNDIENKKLELQTKADIQINDCTPMDLPLIWKVTTK